MSGIETIAAVAHNVLRVHNKAIGRMGISWLDLPHFERDCLRGSVIYAMTNRGASAEQLQQAWCIERMADGWTYGTAFDLDAKQHPALLPFGELSAHDRRGYEMLLLIVRGMTQ